MPGSSLQDILDRLEVLALADDSASIVEGVRDLRERVRSGQVRVVVAGEAKRGKSTLVNAVIGCDLLPRGALPLTSVSTEVRAAAGRGGGVELQMADGTARSAALEDLTGIQGSQGVAGIAGIRRLVVRVDTPMPHPRMTLVDTPGTGSIRTANDAEAGEAYGRMDVALFLLTADAPISAGEATRLDELAGLAIRTFVVLNKIDLVQASERAAVVDFVRRETAAVVGHEVPVFALSAGAGLRARLADDAGAWAASGVPELLDAVVGTLDVAADVERSVRASSRRLALRLLDVRRTALAAHQTSAGERHRRLDLVEEALAESGRRRAEALQICAMSARELSAALSRTAQHDVAAMERSVQGAVSRAVSAAAAAPPVVLEQRADEAAGASIAEMVSTWARLQHDSVLQSWRALRARQQILLDEEQRRLEGATRAALGVRLEAPAVELGDVTTASLRLDLTRAEGWNSGLADVLRHAGPSARRRTERAARSRAREILDRNLGRAQAAVRDQIAQSERAMSRGVRRAFDAQAAGLARARVVLSDTGGDDVARQLASARQQVSKIQSVCDELRPDPHPGEHR